MGEGWEGLKRAKALGVGAVAWDALDLRVIPLLVAEWTNTSGLQPSLNAI